MRAANHEIVHVVQPAFLVNSARLACCYETADDRPLALGYYFALWSAKTATKLYDRNVRYFGPFATADGAQLLQAGAVYLGIAAPANAPRAVGPTSGAACNAVAAGGLSLTRICSQV